tara:strand:- start:234 stop:452 length:219 start_codon:yes stop_codon:yes gene_type:complete
MNGKGSAPRPIPDRETYESNFDAIFGKKNNEPKGKAQMMRDMRERRKKEGLFEMSVWVTSEQEKQVLELLSK